MFLLGKMLTQASAEELNKVSDECEASLLVLNETKFQLKQMNIKLSQLKMSMEKSKQEDSKAYLNDEYAKTCDAQNILHYSHYKFCQSILTDFKKITNNNNSGNKRSSSTNISTDTQRRQVVTPCGMLIDNLQLVDDAYSTAIKAVFGGEC